MTEPTVIDVSHSLGKQEAKRRMRERIGELASHVPGGVADVETSWTGPDDMLLKVTAMGQAIEARLEAQDRLVRVHLLLPPMLAFMAPLIAAAVRRKGEDILQIEKQ